MLRPKRSTVGLLFLVSVACYLPMLNGLLMFGHIHAEEGSIPPHRLALCIDLDYCPPNDLIIEQPTSNTPVTGYFVDSISGSDANSGKSHDQAWRTAAKAEAARLAVGSDVWFKAGGEWEEQLIVDWGGTSGDRAIVGTYHMVDGVEMRGLPNDSDPGSPDTAQSK